MGPEHSNTKPIIKAASACLWRGTNVLLVQRGKAQGYGLWSLPGGRIEPDETAQAAAQRELLEETSLAANIPHFVGDFLINAGDVQYLIACFTGTSDAGQALAQSDAMAVAWINWQRLDELQLAPQTATAIARASKFINL